MRARAVVLLSGGMDSATCLAVAARRDNLDCFALSFDYGQRHRSEIDAAARLARVFDAVEHRTARLDLGALGGSALTDHLDCRTGEARRWHTGHLRTGA